MGETVTHKAAVGTVWASLDRFTCMGLQFVINLILARLLTPGDFGAVGMLAIFVAVSNVLVDGGFTSALIQRKNTSQLDWSTVFYWNLSLSMAIYAVIFFSAPAVARFFHMPVLCGVLRGVGITIILGALMSVQLTRLRKRFAFRTIAIANILSYIFSGIVAISLALAGAGVWCLVIMQLVQLGTVLVIFGVITRWLPSPGFSFTALRSLFGYGGYLLAAGLLQEAAKNLQGLIIGRRFSDVTMGYYSQASKLDRITSYSLPQVIVQVMFPLFSALQSDPRALSGKLLQGVGIIAFLIFPMMSLLILTAPGLISLLYGEKWLPAVPYFRILCVAGLFACLQNINYYAVAARGKSRVLFLWSLWKWGFLLLAILAGVEIGGMYGILWGMVLSEVNIYIVNASLAARYASLPLGRQLKALLPIMSCAVIAFVVSGLVLPYAGVIISALLLPLLYIGVARLLRLRALSQSVAMIKHIRKR